MDLYGWTSFAFFIFRYSQKLILLLFWVYFRCLSIRLKWPLFFTLVNYNPRLLISFKLIFLILFDCPTCIIISFLVSCLYFSSDWCWFVLRRLRSTFFISFVCQRIITSLISQSRTYPRPCHVDMSRLQMKIFRKESWLLAWLRFNPLINRTSRKHFLFNCWIAVTFDLSLNFIKRSTLQIFEINFQRIVFLLMNLLLQLMLFILCKIEYLLHGTVADMFSSVQSHRRKKVLSTLWKFSLIVFLEHFSYLLQSNK